MTPSRSFLAREVADARAAFADAAERGASQDVLTALHEDMERARHEYNAAQSGHRTPEPCEYHEDEGGTPHEWAPIGASDQQCIGCGRTRALPDDCTACQSLDDCRKNGHG